jgi:hypothetical protein
MTWPTPRKSSWFANSSSVIRYLSAKPEFCPFDLALQFPAVLADVLDPHSQPENQELTDKPVPSRFDKTTEHALLCTSAVDTSQSTPALLKHRLLALSLIHGNIISVNGGMQFR